MKECMLCITASDSVVVGCCCCYIIINTHRRYFAGLSPFVRFKLGGVCCDGNNPTVESKPGRRPPDPVFHSPKAKQERMAVSSQRLVVLSGQF